jgi:hypothetical protein
MGRRTVQPKALVTVAPEKGFLHQRTPLDTLGVDEPESACKLKGRCGSQRE